MTKEVVISVQHLTKDYGLGRGIFDLSFEVHKGEVFGFVGTNGSGKTTTIRHIMGFLKADEGQVQVQGLDSWKDGPEIKQFVSYVPGEIAFPDLSSGTVFLKNQAELLGMKNMDYANMLIDKLQLDPSANLKRMSKGMKQKTAIVAALMADKDILILDEPTTGLDPLMRETFLDIVLEENSGHHQGGACDRLLPVGGLLPGDVARPHRGGDLHQARSAHRPERERHHRQAHSRRYGHEGLQEHLRAGHGRLP